MLERVEEGRDVKVEREGGAAAGGRGGGLPREGGAGKMRIPRMQLVSSSSSSSVLLALHDGRDETAVDTHESRRTTNTTDVEQ